MISYIHRFVPARSPAAPTLLALHGTGGNEQELIPIAAMIDRGAAVLSIRGNVLEGGMPRFFRRIAEGVFDQVDLRRRTSDLGDFLVTAAAEYGFDPARVFALGYSNGANIATSLMLSRPGSLAGGILMRPMVPFEPEEPPDLARTRVLISAGQHDPMVPRHQTERLATLLKTAGADVTLSWFDTGHGLISPELEAAARWFAEHKA